MAQENINNKSQLRRAMGFWDVLLFNIAAVLGPRWIAAAAHNGTSSISLWVLAALLFFLPTSLIIIELSTRFPSEGLSRLRGRLVLLGIYGLLLPGTADSQRRHVGVHRRAQVLDSGHKSTLPALVFAGSLGHCRGV
jgi:hypothetical protein